jgi:hypothetical protein
LGPATFSLKRTPTERKLRHEASIVVILAGHGQAADGSWRAASVDERGRIILLRYAEGLSSYSQELTHELVHAFRRLAGFWLSGFLEEGLAEAVTMRVDPNEVGFPRYG